MRTLKRVVEVGFYTAPLIAGGAQDSAKWYAEKHQVFLRNAARDFADALGEIDRNGDLSVDGKAKRRVELARTTLEKVRAESSERFAAAVRKKLEKAEAETAAAGGEMSDIQQLLRAIERHHLQDSILKLAGNEIIRELHGAIAAKDPVIYGSIVGLPKIILREKGVVPETVAEARREWFRTVNPRLAGEIGACRTVLERASAAQVADIEEKLAEIEAQITRIERADK